MNKCLLAISVVLPATLSVFAQDTPEVVLTGTPWGVQGISENNRYICGTRMYQEAYRYDLEERKLMVQQATNGNSELAFLDVMNDGTLIGYDDNDMGGIFRDDRWYSLPSPRGTTVGVWACNGSGSIIVGYVNGSATAEKPFVLTPAYWSPNEYGEYEQYDLPAPELDWAGGTPQWTAPRAVSEDGNTIVGITIEQHGRYYDQIVYRRDESGEWTYSFPFVEKSYNVERYKQLSAEEPKQADYVTAQPGDADYQEQIKAFQKVYYQWLYKVKTEALTGVQFVAPPIMLSKSGKLLAMPVQHTSVEWKEDEGVIEETTYHYPAVYNIETEELTEFKQLTGATPYMVTDNGDMITDDGYNFFLILNETQELINIVDWLQDNYGFDLRAQLPSNVQYIDAQAVSKDLRVLVGDYRSVNIDTDGEEVLDEKNVFCVLLPELSGIIETLNTPKSDSVKVLGDKIVFDNEASDIKVYDMGGRLALTFSGAAAEVSIESLSHGVYVVSATINGQAVSTRVFKD